jgi:hypothetical protein
MIIIGDTTTQILAVTPPLNSLVTLGIFLKCGLLLFHCCQLGECLPYKAVARYTSHGSWCLLCPSPLLFQLAFGRRYLGIQDFLCGKHPDCSC